MHFNPAAPTLDHLVVMAANLEEGVNWCEATLGVTPGPGGEHPLTGTHNRLLNIATPEFPTAYLEIIAINSIATPSIPTRARRWFDMDDPALRAHVAQQGPALVHAVVSVPDIHASVAALGDALAAALPPAHLAFFRALDVRHRAGDY